MPFQKGSRPVFFQANFYLRYIQQFPELDFKNSPDPAPNSALDPGQEFPRSDQIQPRIHPRIASDLDPFPGFQRGIRPEFTPQELPPGLLVYGVGRGIE